MFGILVRWKKNWFLCWTRKSEAQGVDKKRKTNPIDVFIELLIE